MTKITNEDNMILMARYPDNYFDLAIVDPPYGIKRDGQKETVTKNRKHRRKQHIKKHWDNAIPKQEYFTELFRVSKNQIIWGGNYFVEFLNKGTMGWIFWDKGQRICNSDGELAFTSFKRALRVVNYNRVELLIEGTIHPTQKPVKLYEWLLMNYAKEGDKILDTHLGSFSHAIACHNLGFELTACELNKDYFNEGMQRYENHKKQLRIF